MLLAIPIYSQNVGKTVEEPPALVFDTLCQTEDAHLCVCQCVLSVCSMPDQDGCVLSVPLFDSGAF